jgi:NAD(P)H-hydrate epimerase
MSHFFTDSSTPVSAVTPEEMTEMDRIAVEETGPNIYQMMENAGRNLAELVLERVGCAEPIVVFAGIGGNGGGGICAARHIANHGAQVSLVVLHPNDLRPVPAWQRTVYRSTGGAEMSVDSLYTINGAGGLPPDTQITVIDAMLGYNARGALHDAEARAAEWIACRQGEGDCRVISLDLPSGVNALTGVSVAGAVKADVILTLALPKTGLKPILTLGASPPPVPELVLADLGIPQSVYAAIHTERPFAGRYRIPLHLVL